MSITRNGSIMVQGASAAGILSGTYGGTGANLAPTTAGNTIFTTDGTNWSSTQKIVRGTTVSASGTSIDFTGIPSWAKRITVMFVGFSGSGTSSFLIQLGTSSGPTTSGYVGSNGRSATFVYFSSGFILVNGPAASQLYSGAETFSFVGSNTWSGTGTICANSADGYYVNAGYVTLASALTQVRITTVNGTDTFDAGSVNILYE